MGKGAYDDCCDCQCNICDCCDCCDCNSCDAECCWSFFTFVVVLALIASPVVLVIGIVMAVQGKDNSKEVMLVGGIATAVAFIILLAYCSQRQRRIRRRGYNTNHVVVVCDHQHLGHVQQPPSPTQYVQYDYLSGQQQQQYHASYAPAYPAGQAPPAPYPYPLPQPHQQQPYYHHPTPHAGYQRVV